MALVNQSLLKALQVLGVFSRETQEFRLSDIANALDMPLSTTHRILHTLETYDYISQNPTNGQYRLGAAAFILGTNVVSINQLVDAALPPLADLSVKYGATVHIGIEQNGHVLCVEKIESPFLHTGTPSRGSKHALHVTSLGKSILAFSKPQRRETMIKGIAFKQLTPNTIISKECLEKELDEIKKKGYSIDNQESKKNLYCFGAPIFSKGYNLEGAISVSLISNNFPANASEVITDVKKAAQHITEILSL